MARVSPRVPREGLLDVQFDDRKIAAARLLQLRNVNPSHEKDAPDLYARGPDLIVQYPATSTHGLSCQACWRAIKFGPPRSVGVEVVVSVQTDLLDADATISLGSAIPCVEIVHLGEDGTRSVFLASASPETDLPKAVQIIQPGLILYRMGNGAGCCVEMVHPADISTGRIVWTHVDGGLAQSAYTVIGERLEKGVIRRARVQVLFLPRKDDEAAAIECYRRFAASPSPLTA